MLDKIKELLPIGTVVSLKNGTKKLMVFGILQSIQEQSDKEYDYIVGITVQVFNLCVHYKFSYISVL